ncbi:MAG: exonuclease SbcCD subunit D [Sciscionella sp.]|nr:exonuclease SbcCD subunit D [Sciscionella sp.]
MRLLHTSDWHIGRTFHGHDLLADQEKVLLDIADVVAEQRVDVVLVAGDVYDRAVPSADAVAVCTRALSAIRAAGARIVITPGNHDSAGRLGAFGEFAAAGGLYLRTAIAELAEPVELADDHGPVLIYGIPYLEPDPAKHVLGIVGKGGHSAVLTDAMNRVRADLAGRGRDARSVVLAHAFVAGGEPSDSERRIDRGPIEQGIERGIQRGGVERVPTSIFHGIDYVALGHLHGPQRLAEHLRYSGSPLAYSFSEAAQKKSVWLVDLDAGGLVDVRRHYLAVPRRLSTVTGALADLLVDPALEPLTGHYLSATLTDAVRPLDPMRRLRERFSHAVHVEWRPAGGQPQPRYPTAVRQRDDGQLAHAFLVDCRGSAPTDTERSMLGLAFASIGDH